jgi:hypothetical protein
MVLTLFALLLAFSIITLYNQRQEAQAAVSREADDLAEVGRDAQQFELPPPASQHAAPKYVAPTTRVIHKYACEVERNEFPSMVSGKHLGTSTPQYLTAIFDSLRKQHPKAGAQTAFFMSAVTQLNDAVAQRRDRLEHVNSDLPFPLALLLLITAGVSIFLIVLIAFARLRGGWRQSVAELAVIAAVAGVVAVGLFACLLFEFPFSGPLAVTDRVFLTLHGC